MTTIERGTDDAFEALVLQTTSRSWAGGPFGANPRLSQASDQKHPHEGHVKPGQQPRGVTRHRLLEDLEQTLGLVSGDLKVPSWPRTPTASRRGNERAWTGTGGRGPTSRGGRDRGAMSGLRTPCFRAQVRMTPRTGPGAPGGRKGPRT